MAPSERGQTGARMSGAKSEGARRPQRLAQDVFSLRCPNKHIDEQIAQGEEYVVSDALDAGGPDRQRAPAHEEVGNVDLLRGEPDKCMRRRRLVLIEVREVIERTYGANLGRSG